MALSKICHIQGAGVFIPGADIDTDRIIPARFLKCVTFDDLAEGLFYDVRFDTEGKSTNHPLDDMRFGGATIMLATSNFGCGSSREHAPQSIYRSGFRAVIAESFAEIFFGNATGIGLPCLTASPQDIQKIRTAIEENPDTILAVDLVAQRLSYGDEVVALSMPDSAREALISGRWDSVVTLLDHLEEVEKKAESLPYFFNI